MFLRPACVLSLDFLDSRRPLRLELVKWLAVVIANLPLLSHPLYRSGCE